MPQYHNNSAQDVFVPVNTGQPADAQQVPFDDSVAQTGAAELQDAIEVLDARDDELANRDFVLDFITGLQ